jgi:hypothetical protein
VVCASRLPDDLEEVAMTCRQDTRRWGQSGPLGHRACRFLHNLVVLRVRGGAGNELRLLDLGPFRRS